MKITFSTYKPLHFQGINEKINRIRAQMEPASGIMGEDSFTPSGEKTVIIENYYENSAGQSGTDKLRNSSRGSAAAEGAISGSTTGAAIEGTKGVASKVKSGAKDNIEQDTKTSIDTDDASSVDMLNSDNTDIEDETRQEIDEDFANDDVDITDNEIEPEIDSDIDLDIDNDIDIDIDVDVDTPEIPLEDIADELGDMF